jgi:hypothetical protein
MGRTVSYSKEAVNIFEKAKAAVASIADTYGDNLNKKFAEMCAFRDKANHENKTIYFDKEVPLEQLAKLDC